MDAGHARRHQHPGQLHPHQLARLPAEPADLGHGRGVLDHDVGVWRGVGGRRELGADDHTVWQQPVHGQRRSSSIATSKYAANSFFNNAATPSVPKPELSRHQFGGRVGGPIQKDKLFFFGYYEGFRQTTQTSQNLTIPANADFFDGVFRYAGTRWRRPLGERDAAVGADGRLDAAVGLPVEDSRLRRTSTTSTSAIRRRPAVLNTAGYRFNQTDLNNRDQYGLHASTTRSRRNHRFEGVYSYFKEIDDRTDLDFITPDRPLVYTSSDPKRLALAWRWIGSSNFQNEVRGGFNLAPVQFDSDWVYSGNQYTTALGIINPIGGNGTAIGFQPQGRYTNTYQINDTAIADARQPPDSDGRQLAAESRQSVQLRRRVPAGQLRLQRRPRQATWRCRSAQFPGGIAAADLDQRQRDGRVAGRDRHVGRADVPGAGPELGLRRRASRRTRTTRSTTSPPTCRTTGAGSRTSPCVRA